MVLLFSSFSEVQISFAPSPSLQVHPREATKGSDVKVSMTEKIKTNGFILYFVHFSITSQQKIIGI